MMRWEQFEVWALKEDKWQLLGWFRRFELASAMLFGRGTKVKLIHVAYENDRRVQAETLAELGGNRVS